MYSVRAMPGPEFAGGELTPGDGRQPISRTWLSHTSLEVAPTLLGALLLSATPEGTVVVRLTEVEAYEGAEDPGSHAYRGRTPRNEVMFGPAGHLYVYFTYGMHWCANTVCGQVGEGTGVLMRAGAPLVGVDVMFDRRGRARRERDLCSGPAKLCQAMGITGEDDGTDLCVPEAGGRFIAVLDDGTPPPSRPTVTRRVGVSVGVEQRWRWYVPGDPHVSRP